jgi:tellurite resistance protein
MDYPMIDPHAALIYTMVMVSAADREMTDAELQTIGDIVKTLPIFESYDAEKLTRTARDCAELLQGPEGLDQALELIAGTLPERLHETAYALACDVAAADGRVSQEELRLLELMRHRLAVGRLPAAAIERGARARHAKL